MKSGQCPKCGSEDVRAGTDSVVRAGQGVKVLPITRWSYGALDNYVCLNCGNVELRRAALAMPSEAVTHVAAAPDKDARE